MDVIYILSSFRKENSWHFSKRRKWHLEARIKVAQKPSRHYENNEKHHNHVPYKRGYLNKWEFEAKQLPSVEILISHFWMFFFLPMILIKKHMLGRMCSCRRKSRVEYTGSGRWRRLHTKHQANMWSVGTWKHKSEKTIRVSRQSWKD